MKTGNLKMIKQLLLVIIGEVLLISIFVSLRHFDASVAIGEPVLLIIAALISGLLGVFFFQRRQRKFATILFINAFLAPIILHFALKLSFSYNMSRIFDDLEFETPTNKYEILIHKESNTFKVLDISSSGGSSFLIMSGKVERSNDSTMLIGDSSTLIIYKNYLTGFANSKGPIRLNKFGTGNAY